MPRANKLRRAGPRALPRKTTEREKALVTIEVMRQWNEWLEELREQLDILNIIEDTQDQDY